MSENTMPTVLELADRVTQLADQVKDVATRDQCRATVQKRNARLSEQNRQLQALLAVVRELKDFDIEWPEVEWAAKLSTPKASFEEDWLSTEAALEFLDTLTKVRNQVNSAVETVWREHLAEVASAFPDKSTIRLLRERSDNDDTLAAVDGLEDLADDFGRLRSKTCPDVGDASALKELESQVNATWARVSSGHDLSPHRLALLRAVNSIGGHPLNDLNDDDILWLKNSGSAWSLVVRRRS